MISPMGYGRQGVRACEWVFNFSSCVRWCQRGPFPLCWIATGWEGVAGKATDRTLEDIKVTQILLTVSWTPLKSPPMSRWTHLTCRSPQLAHGRPQDSTYLTHTHLHPLASSLCELIEVVMRASFGRWLVNTCRKPTQICGSRRDHNIEF